MLKYFFSIFTALFILTSCQSEPKRSRSADLEKIADLQGQVYQLKLDNQIKDDLVDEALTFFDQIQSNLAAIQLKKNEIKIKSENKEVTEDDKRWIIEEIKHINLLREENGRKVNSLNNELKKSGLKIKELENMIERLVKDIESKDLEIQYLQAEIETNKILKKTITASRALSELKGAITNLPNPTLFIDTINLQEAQASSAI